MTTIRATNLRKDLYQIIARVMESGEPVEVILGGRSAVTIVRSPKACPSKRKPLIDLDAVSIFCRRHGVKTFSLFGSILTPDFSEESDVDVLVDLGDRRLEFREECDMLDELETLFGRKVDMVPVSAFSRMNPRRRDSIVSTAKEIYHAV